MPILEGGSKNYLTELKKRAGESHIYRNYQMVGLEISRLLGDPQHKTLYIKIAKSYNRQLLLEIAKNVAESKTVLNRGAVFMHALQQKVGKLRFVKNKPKKKKKAILKKLTLGI